MTKLVLKLIRFYQLYLPKPDGGCRFSPTCSQYSYTAVQKYGILHGSWLSLKRILRCHPLNPGGLDPVK